MFKIYLYHGTTSDNGHRIESEGIQLSYSQEYLDFSKGFYTTPDIKFAIKTAQRRYSTSRYFHELAENIDGMAVVVLEYNENCVDLNTKIFAGPTNKWAQFIAANRTKAPEQVWKCYDNNRDQRYDIVKGPTADGTINFQEMLKAVNTGKMAISDVKSIMCLPPVNKNWGTQISFHTSKSLNCLKIKNVLYYSGEEE